MPMKNDPRDFYLIVNNEFGAQVYKEKLNFISEGLDKVTAYARICPAIKKAKISSVMLSDGISILAVKAVNILMCLKDSHEVYWTIPAIERDKDGAGFFTPSGEDNTWQNLYSKWYRPFDGHLDN